ncbi:uncharacterized protein PHALS_14921 [Plasmopara halstedii]|uniref:RxLR-like protein n=1 Tax=Plasmopara halstedii TaxID=4781 RepID=A0A0P1A8V3_PLAHL|nr:uncharacterized protein PHALS_14921 [Plasmopara halstedii]CEG36658.1 hypothetical protein PHALS_14921 [Plasmopara halstedii]|eukprot:XP_024573027.1 hypothetical protein PHALS_14921 [Plasmopara halstedii]
MVSYIYIMLLVCTAKCLLVTNASIKKRDIVVLLLCHAVGSAKSCHSSSNNISMQFVSLDGISVLN